MKTRICPARIRDARRTARNPRAAAAAGFTLLELLLALLVAGLILGVSGPALVTLMRSDELARAQAESQLVLDTVLAHEWAGEEPLEDGATLAFDDHEWVLAREPLAPTGTVLRVTSARWAVSATAYLQE
ncbi:MAG: prepilin-type N-terminal cleavage/methylation domain-containing protein [Candidatus Marinimicrobia bacterium]|nr:prepilin-type N-terminal cleavage/methylation domain-containing protein [Candidatus Neomarinimicrobiota bacterium]